MRVAAVTIVLLLLTSTVGSGAVIRAAGACGGIPVLGSGTAFGLGPVTLSGTLQISDFLLSSSGDRLLAVGTVSGQVLLEDGSLLGPVTDQVLVGPLTVTNVSSDPDNRTLLVDFGSQVLQALGTQITLEPSTLVLTPESYKKVKGLSRALSELFAASQFSKVERFLDAVCQGA